MSKRNETIHSNSIKHFMVTALVTVHADSSVEEAFDLMDEYGIRHLPVLKDDHLVGVISDRDIARVWSLSPGNPQVPRVAQAMSRDPYTVDPEAKMTTVLETMASNRLGCVLIKGHGEKLAGIFTTTDAVQLLSKTFGENP